MTPKRPNHAPHPITLMKNHILTKALAIAAMLVGACTARSQSADIQPGIAMGSVHSGMTTKEVAITLGKPDQIIDLSDRSSKKREITYKKLGLTIFTGFSTNIEVVHAVAVNAPFSGKTKESIGIGSSRSEIIKAYGQPTEIKRPGLPNFEVLSYDSPKIKFALQDDKVSIISTEFESQ
jgi:hypothetical protein